MEDIMLVCKRKFKESSLNLRKDDLSSELFSFVALEVKIGNNFTFYVI